MWDGQRALKLIRYLAPQYHIDPKRVGLFGFSAGGHLASTLALHAATDFGLPVHDAVDAMNGHPDILGLG
jgi:acetyl esterase/lipase